MRILHVTDCYLPDLGGIELHVSDLAARQRADGHDVRVMTRKRSAGDDEGFPVVRLSCGFFAVGAADQLRRYVHEHDVDVVHAHLSVASPLAWTALRVLRTTPCVATVHSVVPDSPLGLRWATTLTRFPSRTVAFTAVSNTAADPWRRALGDRMPVSVLPNGIDPLAWRSQHRGSDDATFTVVSVGRFARRKRHSALVDMLAKLRGDLPDGIRLRAVLVGDGRQFAAVAREVRRAGLEDCVDLPGALSREEIRIVHSRADVFVAPATLESFGIAALEARCAGVPVVAMRQGGAGEFITHGREGLLVDGDAEMLDAVKTLATDVGLRETMRRHNTTTVPPMAWPAVLAQHDAAYVRAESRLEAPRRQKVLGSVVQSR